MARYFLVRKILSYYHRKVTTYKQKKKTHTQRKRRRKNCFFTRIVMNGNEYVHVSFCISRAKCREKNWKKIRKEITIKHLTFYYTDVEQGEEGMRLSSKSESQWHALKILYMPSTKENQTDWEFQLEWITLFRTLSLFSITYMYNCTT